MCAPSGTKDTTLTRLALNSANTPSAQSVPGLRGELSEFGSLLGEAWKQKKRMSPLIATDFIEEAYDVAMRAGALGGKVTGAGGGGYILFYCDFARKHRLAEALTRMGGVVTDVAFERRGLTTWRA